MLKTHLRKNPGSLFPACTSYSTADGRLNHAVSAKEFRAAEHTCVSCQKIFLVRRNNQRREKGLAPVSVWNAE
jgi:hypothetical protein